MAHPILNSVKKALSKPQIVVPIAIVIALVIGLSIYLSSSTSKNYSTTPVVLGTVSSGLSSTGIVKAATETDLAFPKGGRVSAVDVAAGATVYQGQTLAALDSSDAQGAVEQAQGAYQAAEASYQRLINGADDTDIAVAQTAVKSAQVAYDSTVAEQNLAVEAAYQKLLSTDLTATTTATTDTAAPVISGTYTGDTEGTITIAVHPSDVNGFFTATGLVNATGDISSLAAQPIGDSGLFILFPADAATDPATWTVVIPNTSGPNYTLDSAAYQSALQAKTDKIAAAQAALDQANASLTEVEAAPRTEDITAAQAAVSSAQGALETAQAALADDFITAPINGTITSINDLTAGQIVSANTPVINIISQGSFQIESYVSEKDLPLVTLNEPVSIITDAYGPDVVFPGTVLAIAPAATTQANGDLGYKITYQFTGSDPRIKPGISATINLAGATKTNVLTVPSTAVFQKNGSSFVLVKNGKATEDRAVTVGLVGTDTVEITSGLSVGEQVVTLGQ